MKLLTYLQQTHGTSRRTCTEAIKRGEIMINNQPVISFGHEIGSGDRLSRGSLDVTIEKFSNQPSHLLLFHKPIGYVVSRSDPHNPTIFQLLPDGREKIYYPIGRLDKDSSGLLLLTDDPKLVHELLHPSKKLKKIYHVVIVQPWNEAHTPLIKRGCWINAQGDEPIGNEPADLLTCLDIVYQRTPTGPTLLTITLGEGKNRHIRRLMRYLGYRIISLQRVSFGERSLAGIEPGEWKEIESLMN